MCLLAISCTYILHSGYSYPPFSYFISTPTFLVPSLPLLRSPSPSNRVFLSYPVGLQFLLRSDPPASVNPVIISATFTREYRHLLPCLALDKKIGLLSLPVSCMYVCIICVCLPYVIFLMATILPKTWNIVFLRSGNF